MIWFYGAGKKDKVRSWDFIFILIILLKGGHGKKFGEIKNN